MTTIAAPPPRPFEAVPCSPRSDANANHEAMTLTRAKAQLKEAFDLIPDEDKVAYTRAMKEVPHLVELESNPERYLKFDNFDPWAASRRIVDYWEARVHLFKERAFLPMILTGQGALSDADMDVFRTGTFMVLPNDMEGRPVIFHDRARLTTPEVMVPIKRIRCLFYMFMAVSEMDCSRDKGIVGMSVYSSKTRKSTFDLKMILEFLNLFCFRQVIPVKIDAFHLVMISSRPIMNAVVPATLQAFEKLGSHKPNAIMVHTGNVLEDLQEDLTKRASFQLEGLPKVPLGGLFTFGCFRKWIDARLRQERRLYHIDAENFHMDGSDSGAEAAAAALPSGALEDDPEEELTRKRREVDAAYARRKRARKKIEMQVLESEVDRLTRQQQSLRSTGDLLEQKLEEARHIVQIYSGERQPLLTSAWNRQANPNAATVLGGAPRLMTLNAPPLAAIPQVSSSQVNQRFLSDTNGLVPSGHQALAKAFMLPNIREQQQMQQAQGLLLQGLPVQPPAPGLGRFHLQNRQPISAQPPAPPGSYLTPRLITSATALAPGMRSAVPPFAYSASSQQHSSVQTPSLRLHEQQQQQQQQQQQPQQQQQVLFQELYNILSRSR